MELKLQSQVIRLQMQDKKSQLSDERQSRNWEIFIWSCTVRQLCEKKMLMCDMSLSWCKTLEFRDFSYLVF